MKPGIPREASVPQGPIKTFYGYRIRAVQKERGRKLRLLFITRGRCRKVQNSVENDLDSPCVAFVPPRTGY
jgi:hypothetical protein